MNKPTLILLLISLCACHISIVTPLTQIFSLKTRQTQNMPSSRYDACLDKLEVIVANIFQCAKLCLDNRSDESIPITLATIGLLYNDIMCFINAHNNSSTGQDSFDLECVIDHLQKAYSIIKLIREDFVRKDWQQITQHFMEIADILKDTKSCY